MGNLIQTGSVIELPPFNLVIDVDYTGVMTTFTYPAGTAFHSVVDLSDGEMSVLGDEWTIDNYVKNFNSYIIIKVEVTDVALFGALAPEDRKVVGDTTDLTGEVQLLDNVAEKLIEGITCVDVNDCITTNLQEFDSMAEAILALGEGEEFLASVDNIEGWPWRVKLVTPFS